MKPPRLLAIALATAMILAPALPARAWQDHDLLTREMLRSITWLNAYRGLKVTPWTYEADDHGPYNPDFKPLYLDKLVGEKTTAREILVRYVDEPDWGMDLGMDLSPLQAIASGSYGYRHERLMFFHQVVKIGEAPQRARANYDLAMIAFHKRDPYWGFRYLARCLHYLEDSGDPLNTHGFRWNALLEARGDFNRVRTQALNLHHYYDAYVSYHLRKQEAKGGGEWVQRIQEATAADVFDAKAAAEALAMFVNEDSEELLVACEHFWPRKIRSMKAIQPIRDAFLDPPEPPPSYGTLMALTGLDLHVTGKMVRGLMAKARRDIQVQSRPPEDD